ncbi:MAG: hypothetical protein H0T78_08670, partial [Longispora sp.]|nr:hypothetical protein [Longispora sp. (in: high G+C Gram-positive bacteria)]
FRYAATTATALLAAVTSPVAGLFVGLVGVALYLSRYRNGALLAACAAVGIGLTGLLFGEGGAMNISLRDTIGAIGASLIVALFAAHRPVRIGALLSAAGVLAAFLIDTPVGLNATRLATMFALPVLVATAAIPNWSRVWRTVVTAGTVLGVVVLAPPVVLADIGDAGNPANQRAYFAPLEAASRSFGVQRVEVVPTRNYWEAAYVSPLARGWLRQVDRKRNPILFENLPGGRKLTAENYLAWLQDNAVSHVALSDAELSWLAKPEAALIRGGLSYLTEVWRDEHWHLYSVANAPPLVESSAGPGLISAPVEVTDQTADSLTFTTTSDGEVLIRVRYSRWLTLPGARPRPGPGGWTVADIPNPGRYTLSSTL